METAGRFKISGKFPDLQVELDGKPFLCEQVSLYFDAKSIPTALITFPLLKEVDIDIPALLQVSEA